MLFLKPKHYEITLLNSRNDQHKDIVLIYTINKDYELIEHAPLDLFFYSRNMAMITGINESGQYVSKEHMQIRTNTQRYSSWGPILTLEDFKKAIQTKINNELAKRIAFESDPKRFSFYRNYKDVN